MSRRVDSICYGLLSATTALTSLTVLSLLSAGQAMAACDIAVPANGQTVTCTGADTTGISGGANNVTIVGSGVSSINTTGTSAIDVGSGLSLTTLSTALSSVSSNSTTIRAGGGAITLGSSSAISSSTGTAIQFTGSAGTAFNVSVSGTVTGIGTAIDFGDSAATLSLGNAGEAINGNVIAGSGITDRLQLTGSGSSTFNVNDIDVKYTGFEQFAKTSAGSWTLSGTGNQAWDITAGTLQGDTTSMSGNLAISSGANATFNQSTNGTYAGVASGAGQLTKTGSGTVTLSGTNTHTGGTTVSGGILAISSDSNLGGAGALTLNGAALQLSAAATIARAVTLGASGGSVDSGSFTSTLSGVISGTGALTKTGSGTISLGNTAHTYTGGTTVSAGILRGTAVSVQGNVANNATVVFNQSSADGTYAGVMSGSGVLQKEGNFQLILSGTNTYTGGTNVTGGSIRVTSDANLGNTSGGITLNGGTLQYGAGFTSNRAVSLGGSNGTIDTNGFNGVLSNNVTGTGGLTKTGTGRLTLNGTNSYTGGTTVSGGILQGTTNSLQGSITNNATVDFNQSASGTYSGVISGSGALNKSGTGTVTLSGTNTYTGGTTIVGGQLNISADNNLGNASGALTLNSGATLGFTSTMTLARNVALAGNAIINTSGNNITSSGVVSGAGQLIKSGSGILLLNGTNTFTGGVSITNGVVRASSDSNLGHASGSIAMDGGTFQYITSGFSTARNVQLGASGGTIDTNGLNGTWSGVFSGTGGLTKTSTGVLTLSGVNTYTGGTGVTGGFIRASADNNLGGAGTLTLNGGGLQYGANFTSSRAITVGAGNGTIDTQNFSTTLSGVISGTGALTIAAGTGLVSLTNTNTYSGGTILSSGSLRGNTGSLQGNITNNGTVTFNQAGSNGTYAGVMSGTGALVKEGGNSLTLSGTNTYSGGTTISNGFLRVSSDENLGNASGSLNIDSGALQFVSGFTTSRAVNLGSGGGTFQASSTAAAISGTVSGTGSLTKTGISTLTLSGTNTYTGGTVINDGQINISSNDNLGDASGGLTMNGGTLANTAGVSTARAVNLAGSGTFNTSGGSLTLSGVISGAGSLNKIGAGTLVLSGTNTYTGGTAINGGQVNISSDSNLGNSSGALSFDGGILATLAGVTSARNVALNAGGGTINTNGFNSTISGAMTGTGSFTKSGTGTLILSGTNTYSGGTTVSAGELRGSTTSLQGDIVNNANLRFDQTGNGTYSGIISGTGAVQKGGTGVVTLSGANTYTGGTTISVGTLAVSAHNNLGATSSVLTLSASTLRYDAGFSSARNVVMGSGGTGTFDTNGFNATLSGIISGAGVLGKTGAGTLILSGTNTYTGGTSITGGELRVSADNNLGGAGNLSINGGTLLAGGTFTTARNIALSGSGGTINTQASVVTASGVISGSGGLTKLGTGNLTLSGNNTYTGGTNLSGGELIISSDSRLGDISGVLTISNGAILKRISSALSIARNIVLGTGGGAIHTNGNTVLVSGNISGSGSLTKFGTTLLTLTGTNTYTGGTIIDTAALSVSVDANLGDASGGLTLAGGTLQYGAGFSSARAISLGAGGGTFDTNGNDATLSGIIGGGNSLTKSGGGILTLEGVNTYTGGTTVSGGTLRGTTDSIKGNVSNSSQVDFNQNTNGTYSNIVSGTGSLQKDGAGTLIFTGANTYTGATTVNNGKFVVNGSILSTATVASGASLGGSGTVGNIIANGTIAPGNSIGTLNVNGAATFNAGSFYDVEVDDAGNADKIIATGAVTINGGTVNVLAEAGSYSASTNYGSIIQGTSRTGTFDGVTSNLAFLLPTLSYTATSVNLSLARNNTAFSDVGDAVQQQVASAVEALGAGNDLYDAFLGLSQQDAPAALDILSGEHNTGLVGNAITSTGTIMNIVSSRVQSLSPVSAGPSRRALSGNSDEATLQQNRFSMSDDSAQKILNSTRGSKNAWSEIYGQRGQRERNSGQPSQDSEGAGILFGADMPLGPSSYIGAFGGWEKGEVYTDSQNANSDIQSWHGGLYGTYFPDQSWRISGGVSGTYQDIDTTRHIRFPGFDETAKGETEGYAAAAFVETGYGITYKTIEFEPYAGLQLQHSYIGGYKEINGGGANLDVASATKTVPSHSLGVRFGRNFVLAKGERINLHVNFGWRHNYGDLDTSSTMRFTGGPQGFSVFGNSIARDAAMVGLGGSIDLDETSKLYMGYDGSFSGLDRNHVLAIGLKTKF